MAPVSTEEFLELGERLSNWGRWGSDDQAGTLNFIGPAEILGAAAAVVSGRAFSLSAPLGTDARHPAGPGRFKPIHLMTRDGGDIVSGAFRDFYGGADRYIRATDDVIIMPLHCGTHWDALAHVMLGDFGYNGCHAREVTSTGAKRNGIEQVAGRVVGRAVLLDIPRLKRRRWLDPGEPVHAADLQAAVDRQQAGVQRGDILLVRTGQPAADRESGRAPGETGSPTPGLALDTLAWIARHQIAAVATDTWVAEVVPNETADVTQPFHAIAIAKMGLLVGELFQLETLAHDCAADGRYVSYFCAPPLVIPGAVGSPVNPIAVK